jgi:hypothetical protein
MTPVQSQGRLQFSEVISGLSEAHPETFLLRIITDGET